MSDPLEAIQTMIDYYTDNPNLPDALENIRLLARMANQIVRAMAQKAKTT